MDASVARRMWTVFEPYHALIYFAPEARDAYRVAGLKGYWMGYFASRAAAMGPAPAALITATFYNFAPRMVERAIPDAWRFSSPERVLSARVGAADQAIGRLLGDMRDAAGVREASALARRAAAACDAAGRPLFAAHSALPYPESPHLALWHATTLLRECRFDGHNAALLGSEIDGCEAHVLAAAGGTVARATSQPNRGWSDDEWAAAAARLTERGCLDDAGAITARGREIRAAVEDSTDRLALAPWRSLGDEATARLYALLETISGQITEAGGIPVPNPIGLPAPGSA